MTRSVRLAASASRAARGAEGLARASGEAARDEQRVALDVDRPQRAADQRRREHVPRRDGTERVVGDADREQSGDPELRDRDGRGAPRRHDRLQDTSGEDDGNVTDGTGHHVGYTCSCERQRSHSQCSSGKRKRRPPSPQPLSLGRGVVYIPSPRSREEGWVRGQIAALRLSASTRFCSIQLMRSAFIRFEPLRFALIHMSSPS